MSEDTTIVPVTAARLSRLREAATLAAEGAFSDAEKLLEGLSGDAFGEVEQVILALITDYKVSIDLAKLSVEEFRESKRELLQKLEMIEQQRSAMRKLSAPIIDVGDSVVAMPLTGRLDRERAQEIAGRLLARIQEARTAWVILDLTGIEHVDSEIGDHLINLASAVRLMGARCLVTGIPAPVAQALVSLGTSLEGLVPISSLKEALRYCLAQNASRSAGPHVGPRDDVRPRRGA